MSREALKTPTKTKKGEQLKIQKKQETANQNPPFPGAILMQKYKDKNGKWHYIWGEGRPTGTGKYA